MNKQKRLANKVKKLGFCFVRTTGVRADSQSTSCSLIPPELKIKALLEEESQMFFQDSE